MARKRGRPRKATAVITTEILLLINRLALRGVPNTVIAKQIGCSHQTIAIVIAEKLRPLWRESIGTSKEEQIARINDLRGYAWEQLTSTAPVEFSRQVKDGKEGEEVVTKKIRGRGRKFWANVIQWCLAEVSRLEGHYRTAEEGPDSEAPTIVPIVVNTREDVERLSRLRISYSNGVLEGQVVKQHANGNGHANGHANGDSAEGDNDE